MLPHGVLRIAIAYGCPIKDQFTVDRVLGRLELRKLSMLQLLLPGELPFENALLVVT